MLWASSHGIAQEDSTQNRPAQVTFIYPLSTNGIESPKYSNHFSLNILSGVNGGVSGLEIGGISNVNKGNVRGFQAAGICNVNFGKTNGATYSGIANVLKDSLYGISVAGISNVQTGDVLGGQIAGISNTTLGHVTGLSIAGISNVTKGKTQGLQVAGIANFNLKSLKGAQIAGIANTIHGDLTGAQIGLINTAQTVRGCQIGLINISDSMASGLPIGLLSYVRNGYHAIEVVGGDAIPLQVNAKLGVQRLYTIYKFGIVPNGDKTFFTYGLGMGSIFPMTSKLAVSIDVSASSTASNYLTNGFDLLAQGNIAVRYNITSWLSAFAGPSFNVYLAETHGTDANRLHVPYTIYTDDWDFGDGTTSIWIGGNGGVTFQF